MKITLNNYEELLLDYSDGKLSEEMQLELQAFLLSHPDLGISLDDLELPVLEQEESSEDLGELLLKFQTPGEEEICKYLEGAMSPAELFQFENRVKSDPKLAAELAAFRKSVLHPENISFEHKEFLKRDKDPVLDNKAIQFVEGLLSNAKEDLVGASAELQQEIKLFQLTRLSPDPELFFENKNTLKRSGRVIPLFPVRTIAAAAALFLVATLSVIYFLFSEQDSIPLAVKKSNTEEKGNKAAAKPANNINEKESIPSIQKSRVRETFSPVPLNTAIAKEERLFNRTPEGDSASAVLTDKPETSLAQNTENPEQVNEPVKPVTPDTSGNTRTTVAFNDLPLVEEDLTYVEEEETRVSFWQRITRLAGEANRLGVKAVDGEVLQDEGFRLSINSISIEKK